MAGKSCYMCDNARINPELTDENDLSYITIGEVNDGFQITMCSGDNKPLRIEFEMWNNSRKEMSTVGRYYPQYCPNCGRKIEEYNRRADND